MVLFADKKGDVAWLDEFNDRPEDCGYADFYNSIDALAIGNNTFEQILTFGPWPYPGKKSYIFSDNKKIKKNNLNSNDIESGFSDVDDLMKKIATQNIKRLWLVGGAQLVNSLSQLCPKNFRKESSFLFRY